MFNPALVRAFDTETHKFAPGRGAPPIVCASFAEVVEEQPDAGVWHKRVRGVLIPTRAEAVALGRALLEGIECTFETNAGERISIPAGVVLTGVHLAYDLACLGAEDESLLPLLFAALRQGRVLDLAIAMQLDAIAGGHLGLDPRTGKELRDPVKKSKRSRYSLASCVDLVLGRVDAKAHAAFRTSYALLEGVPAARWPEEARVYPVEDAENSLEVALRILAGWPRGQLDPYEGPARNLSNMREQAEAALCLHLGSCWGLRTDSDRVDVLSVEVDRKHQKVVERFQKIGWVRSPCDKRCGQCEDCEKAGTEDSAAVKRAVALAYGATGICARCDGRGRVEPEKKVECRGEKVRGRYRGCSHGGEVGRCATCQFVESMCRCVGVERVFATCATCGGSGQLTEYGEATTCRGQDGGCDGTGFDLSTAPMLPRTDKGGVKTDRDAQMESGDDSLYDYAENEFEKVRSTFVPWLRRGIINPSANVLVASGRCSYEGGPMHQLTREGGYWVEDLYIPSVRECFRARGAWCGSPIEYVFGSTDFEAGELCALAQFLKWVVGQSRMLDAINASGKPGILHSELAAEIIGIPIDEFLVRLKRKDKQAVDYRQSSKPISFGAPARMGAIAIVVTSRKKSAGTTVLPDGRKVAGIRFCVMVGGARECGVNKFVADRRDKPPAVVCSACVDVVRDVLLPAYFRRFPEIEEYFAWIKAVVDDPDSPMPTIPSLVWDAERQKVAVSRRRGGLTTTAACNNGFQSMLADVGKLAYVTMTREGYLGVRDDGSPSPLAGARFPAFMHDEPFTELPLQTAHLAGPRIAEIMETSGRKLAPDVVWRAETALAHYLSKSMEPVYVDVDGKRKLVPWEPRRPQVSQA